MIWTLSPWITFAVWGLGFVAITLYLFTWEEPIVCFTGWKTKDPLHVVSLLQPKIFSFSASIVQGTPTLGHLGLSSQAFSASSSAAWCRPSLRSAAERLLYRMQFCGSACKALVYKWTAAWKSPRWHASLLCCTFSMKAALLRPHLTPPSPETQRIGLPAVREPKIENWKKGQRRVREKIITLHWKECPWAINSITSWIYSS